VNVNVLGISDISKALDLSETTVSRALSGKGRVSPETRRRVKEYAQQNSYVPNSIAQSLVTSKSYNIAFVMTGTPLENASFFRQCLIGVCSQANAMSYDVVIVNSNDNDERELERIITKRKVDGIIITRELIPEVMGTLKKYQIPFILLGSSEDDEVNQVDTDVIKSGEELIAQLTQQGIKKIAYIGELDRYTVNRRRLQGVKNASGSRFIFTCYGIATGEEIDLAIAAALKERDCIITNDDAMCLRVMNALGRMKIAIPHQIKLASLYHDYILDMSTPRITGINHNPQAFGIKAAETLINILEADDYPKQGNKLWVEYSFIFGESTK